MSFQYIGQSGASLLVPALIGFPLLPFKFIEPVSIFLVLIDFLFQNIKTIPILRTSAPDMPQTLCNSMSLEIVGFLAVLPTVVEIRLVLLLKKPKFCWWWSVSLSC